MFELVIMKPMGQKLPLNDPFFVKMTDMRDFLNRPARLEGGALFFCTKGSAVLMIDTREYEVAANSEVFLMPHAVFMLVRADAEFQTIFFSFSHAMFENAAYRLDTAFFHYVKTMPIYSHSSRTIALARSMFEVLLANYNDVGNVFRGEMLNNNLRNMLLNISDKVRRNYADLRLDEDDRKAELLHRFVELITIHSQHHRDVAYYADELCISKGYLAAVTRSMVGKTPKQLIDNWIVQEIKILLTLSNVPLQTIADRLNFPDQSYLGRFFKRYTSMSLTEYRRRK